MNILAIDTTTKTACVSLKKEKELYTDKIENEITHSEKLLPLIDKVLQNANLKISEVNKLACINGPGSFTGIRIGLATIKAIAQVKNLDIFSINSLELIAYTTFVKKGLQNNTNIISIISTNNDRVFYCIYNISIKNEKLVMKNLCEIQNEYIDDATKKINDFVNINKNTYIISGNCIDEFESEFVKLTCDKYNFYPSTNDCINIMNNISNLDDYIFNAYTLKATYARPSQAERMKNAKN